MKKILTLFSLFLVMILGACSSLSNDELIKDYVKDTHGIDIVIKDSYKNSLKLGEDSYVVSPVDHQEIEFSVVVYSHVSEDELNYKNKHLIKDNYLIALEADTELHKLDKVMPDINKLGFDESFNDENRVFIGEVGERKAIWSFLYSTSHMEMVSFEEKDLDRLFELYKLVKQSGALFDTINVSDMRELHERETFVLDMEKLKGVNTKEDFLLEMKKINTNIASFYENKKWEAEKQKIENERFTFDSKYTDYWFNCRVTNENGECTNIFVTVYFKENSLTKTNINLEKDLNSIFTLFEKTINPKASIEYNFLEEGSDESVRFTDYEIQKYASTLDFINKNFK